MRYMIRNAAIIGSAVFMLTTGCTHTQLRRNTVEQSGSLSEIHQNQVLNNLAKFVHDPNSLPDFSFPKEGISYVDDKADLNFLINWAWAGSGNNNFAGGAQRNVRESWTLEPIRDPRKLELMRCAYQRAAATCCRSSESAECPSCSKRFSQFYEADATGQLPIDTDGAVNSDCLFGCCWFHVGTKNDVPKNCHCNLVGEHCGTYVWVCPGRGTDQLTKLTLAILDYAVNPPKAIKEPGSRRIVKTYSRIEGKIQLEKWTEEYNVAANAPNRFKNKEAGTFEEFGPNVDATEGDVLPADTQIVAPPGSRSGGNIIIAPGGLQQSALRLQAAGIDL